MVSMAPKNGFAKKLLAWRVWVQAGFLLVWLDPLALRLHSFCAPVFHCYACPLATFACPIGVLAHFSALHVFPFVALGILVMAGGIFGGFICGWACPFGLLQDLAAKIPIPKLKITRRAGYLRYAVLIGLVLAVPYLWGGEHPLFFCSVCPAGALEAAAPNMVSQAVSGSAVTWPNTIKLTVTLVLLAAIFFIHRPWCRLLCPLGAIFGLFNRIAVFFLRFDPASCIDCGICHNKCTLALPPDKNPSATSCIRCLECTHCPTGALQPGSLIPSRKED